VSSAVHAFRRDVVETLRPPADSPHGHLPPLLIVLTIVTGLVDALSYLRLGHVFVANMTGNVVFLGFAIGGGSGLSVPASLVAIALFLVGGMAGGRLGANLGDVRTRALGAATTVQLALVAAAAIVAAVAGVHGAASRYPMIVLLATAMGIQNAIVRRLGVPDLTTTVLTQTLTGIAADLRIAGGSESHLGRRVLAVIAMLLGAIVGALLVLKVAVWTSLAVAVVLLAGVIVAAGTVAREATG
jgi:uncharacterized membrane protein YoaK (UPF0700 family)